MKHRFRPGGVEEIIQRRAEGIQCYLMTSASSYLADLAAEFLELDGVIAQRFEVQNGVFTGYSEGELCFGEGKLHLAQALLSSRAVDPSNCYFYTDSFTDLPLLQSVGFPRCVFPDPHLRRAANKEKWPILAW